MSLIQDYTTKSGKPLQIGTGSGTKWQWAKKGQAENSDDGHYLHRDLVDQLVLAINLGYRHIDLAETYTTSLEVGTAIKESGVPREDIFVTSKYSPGFYHWHATSDGPLDALDKVLKELDTSYLDLFLIHTPFFAEPNSRGQTISSAWLEMIEAKKLGKVRHIGVSNFAVPHLQETFKVANYDAQYYPKFNQIEFHPYLQNQSRDIVKFCHDNGIVVEAYGPLSPLWRIKKEGHVVTDHPLTTILPQLSNKYGKTAAQILLRWTLQKHVLPITTSSKAERITESLEVYNFKLAPEDVALVDKVGATFKFREFFDDVFDPIE